MKMKNEDVARILYEIAEMLDIRGGNRFKPIAFRGAARSVETLPINIKEVYKKDGVKGLMGIPGVGMSIAEHLEEIIKTGKSNYHIQLRKKIPANVSALMDIPGLGPKKIKKLNEKLGIKNLKDLKKAAKSGKIAKLPGFGEESEKDILENIGLAKKSRKERTPLREAEKIAKPIVNLLMKLKETKKVEVMGSLRRKRPTIGDIDILASSNKPEKLVERFVRMRSVVKVVAEGKTKVSVVLKFGVNCDLRIVKPESWGAASLYFVGSKGYNIKMRRIAIRKGYKLSEYGLFDKKENMIAGKTEIEVYNKLGLKYRKPEDREV